jgi:hypothetical protein
MSWQTELSRQRTCRSAPPVGSTTANPAKKRHLGQAGSWPPQPLSGTLPPTIASGSEPGASGSWSWTVFRMGRTPPAATSGVIGGDPVVRPPRALTLRRPLKPFDGDAREPVRSSYDFVTTTPCTQPAMTTPTPPSVRSGLESRQHASVYKPEAIRPGRFVSRAVDGCGHEGRHEHGCLPARAQRDPIAHVEVSDPQTGHLGQSVPVSSRNDRRVPAMREAARPLARGKQARRSSGVRMGTGSSGTLRDCTPTIGSAVKLALSGQPLRDVLQRPIPERHGARLPASATSARWSSINSRSSSAWPCSHTRCPVCKRCRCTSRWCGRAVSRTQAPGPLVQQRRATGAHELKFR